MTFKSLYWGLVAILAGLLCSVFFASEKLDQERFGSPSFDRQVAVSLPNGELQEEASAFKYSPSIRHHLTLPLLLSVVVGIAIGLGIVVTRKESKEPNKTVEDNSVCAPRNPGGPLSS
jgi:hypothetical protein